MTETKLSDLKGRKVLLGVTGGISAYKTVSLASLLIQSQAELEVIMTPSALQMVGKATFQGIISRPVRTDLFDVQDNINALHIYLANWADIMVIAPVTANSLAKLANGFGDNLLLSTVLACDSTLLLAPAMNNKMWNNRFVQENVEKLKLAGINFAGPAEGNLACGTKGSGRMSEPEQIYREIVKLIVSS